MNELKNLKNFPLYKTGMPFKIASVAGSVAVAFLGRIFSDLTNKENTQTFKKSNVLLFDLQKAKEELAYHKLSVSEGAIWSNYGMLDKEGKYIAEDTQFVAFEDMEEGWQHKRIKPINDEVLNAIPNLFHYVQHCHQSREEPERLCLAPLHEATYKWTVNEIISLDLGHISKPQFKPSVSWDDLSDELKDKVPYYTEVLRVAIAFNREYIRDGKNMRSIDLTEFYGGMNPYYGQIKDNGGIGVVANYMPSTILTPWGEFTVRLMTVKEGFHERLKEKFSFILRHPRNEVKHVGWFGPTYSITRGIDGDTLSEIVDQTDYIPYETVKGNWKQIRDHVFVEACKQQRAKDQAAHSKI